MLRKCVVALGLLALITLPAAAEEVSLKTISDSGITVSYPPNMEATAKRVLQIAVTSIRPSIEIQKQIAALTSNADSLAQEIVNLLGSEEVKEETKNPLLAYKDKSTVLAACFSNIRLVPKGDAVALGGIDAGIVQLRYVPDRDEFAMSVQTGPDAAGRLARSYYPVVVNADGAIPSERKLVDTAVDFLGANKAMIVAAVHEVVGYIITDKLKLYHPFARWFNEGVAGWVTRKVVTKADPKLTSLANEIFNVSPASKRLRDRVNLIAWPQVAFQNRQSPSFDATMEAAQTQCSVEIISQLLGGNRGNMLAKMMSEAKYSDNPNTDAILAAIKKAIGTDLKKTLMTYVPVDVKHGMETGGAKKLASQAEKLVQEKSWKPAADKLRAALQMTPEDLNMRLNLAWIEREIPDRTDSELQVLIASRLVRQKDYSFHMYAPSVEGNYVLGRFAVLVGNLEVAKQFLEPVLQLKPDHQDAKRALDEIRRIEAALAGKGG